MNILEDIFGQDGADVAKRIALALAILVVTWALRLALNWLAPRVVKRLTTWTRNKWDDQIVRAVLPPLRLLILVWGLGLAIAALEPSGDINMWSQRILGAIGAYAVFWGLFRLVEPALTIGWTISQRSVKPGQAMAEDLQDKLKRVLGQITKAIVVILGFAVVLETWGYNVAGLVAGLGIGGLAVALAAQDTLSHLIGYFAIIADEPFVVGEYVVFNDISGTVEHIGFRSTRIRVLDQSVVAVPNNTIANASVTNWSRLSKRRLNMTIGIEYNSSPDQILSVVQSIREMLQEHDLVEPESVVVQFVEFNASSLDLIVICFVNAPAWGDFQAAKQDINLKIIDIVEEYGAAFAFPSRTVYMEQVERTPADEIKARSARPKPEPTSGTASDSPVPADAAN